MKKIAIGCDHAGFPIKKQLIAYLESTEYEVVDFGTNSAESVDYPDFIHPVAEAITKHLAHLGIIMCGSGNGVAMTANKHQDIRAAVCWHEDLASLARLHNDANILSIPVRFVSEQTAIKMVEKFITTEFEGGRHQRRVDKIACASISK